MMSQLCVNWEISSTTSANEKATFFDDDAPVVHRNTLRSHFGQAQEPIYHFASKDIVDVIIGDRDMFFDPDERDFERLRGAYDRSRP
jgi:hypothetical protein